MSKTYRDVIRGKHNHKLKQFKDNPDNYEMRWVKFYKTRTLNDRLDGKLFLESDAIWELCRREKIGLRDPWDELSYDEQCKIFPGYSKNPSWWNRLFHTKPNRKRDKNLLRKYDARFDAECDAKFSHAHKPNKYYW